MSRVKCLTAILCLLAVCCSLTTNLRAENPKLRRQFYLTTLKKEKATLADATQVAYMLKFGSLHEGTADERIAMLVENNIAPGSWANKDQAMDVNRGQVALLISNALRIKGSLKMRLGIRNERYCFRNAVFMGLVPRGNQRRLMSGAELIGILDKCSEYQSAKDAAKK